MTSTDREKLLEAFAACAPETMSRCKVTINGWVAYWTEDHSWCHVDLGSDHLSALAIVLLMEAMKGDIGELCRDESGDDYWVVTAGDDCSYGKTMIEALVRAWVALCKEKR